MKDKSVSRAGSAQHHNAALPAYHRLYVLLSEGIKSGKYPMGDLLPSENALVDIYKMSRVTVRRALEKLVEDGLVIKHRGQGTIVAQRDDTFSQDENKLSGFLEDLVAQNVEFTVKTLLWEERAPSEFARKKLALRRGEKCLLIRRVRLLDNLPISYASIYLPAHVGKLISKEGNDSKLIIRRLDDTEYVTDNSEYSLSASLAEGECADLLELAVGSPVLRMRGVANTPDGTPVYCQDSLYHPERYEYGISFKRDHETGKMIWVPKH
ncbi:GntR family transcriptional regulator [Hirschia litorea]|uniref:GntR family transcriptional regulator n=1 Tax=Hirschia litorea TaxID=1199156 RepID=A0ABW2IPA5_9PROT